MSVHGVGVIAESELAHVLEGGGSCDGGRKERIGPDIDAGERLGPPWYQYCREMGEVRGLEVFVVHAELG